ncbi:DnaJ domain-containing protein [Flavobacteriales bacterium]|nr:DnaJ domain-containing protein [Flavobacteriales bacterium]
MKKYFEILGLQEGASLKEVQDAFDKLSVELDPEKNDNLEFFKEEFILLQEAYNKIIKHLKRNQLKEEEQREEEIDNISADEEIDSAFMQLKMGVSKEDHDCDRIHPNHTHAEWQRIPVLKDQFRLRKKTKLFTNKRVEKDKPKKDREEPILKKKGSLSSNQVNTKKTHRKTLIRLVFGVLIFLGIIYFIKINSIEKIYGCIDPVSINYDVSANTMLDSSCVRFKYLDWNDMYPKNKVYVDMRRYTDIEYYFIYNYTDTISKRYRTNYEYDDVYYEIQILNIDTIFQSLNKLDRNTDKITSFYLPAGKKIKVKEKVKSKTAKNYSINIIDEKKNKKNYLLNPRSHYRYKIEKAEYGKLAFGFRADPIYKRGFIFELDHDIDYWFKDFPASITVYDNEYGLGIYIRRNINSY